MFGRIYFDVFFFSFFSSIIFCFFCSLVDNMLGFWVFLELCGLSLVPSFFCGKDSGIGGFYSSLLRYIIMAGVSSVLLVSGLLFNELYYFIFFGFVVKFGLFPFSFWVYRVFSNRGWGFIFFLSVIMKFPVLFFCFLFQGECLRLVYVDCFVTILMCGVFFWFFSSRWGYIWCHISLSSVSTLVVVCFSGDAWICFFIYFYYFVWACLCLFYFSLLRDVEQNVERFWWYCFLLLITPVSFPLVYKLRVCFGIFYSSFYILLSWIIYRFSEQFFLYKIGSDFFYRCVYKRWV